MASSIREFYDICQTTGGFSTVVRCVSSLRAILHRAGNDDEDYTLEIEPARSSGDMYTFALPVSVFSYPVGYYDVDLYDGDLYKRTIRLNLHTSNNAGRTEIVQTECTENRSVAPNVEVVVECETRVCPALCPIPCTVSVDVLDRCDIRIGTSFVPILTQSEEEIRMARIAEMTLLSNIRPTPTVAFEFEEGDPDVAGMAEEIILQMLDEQQGG